MSNANRTALRRYSEAFWSPGLSKQAGAAATFFAPDAEVNVVHPVNDVAGADGYVAGFLAPLSAAFDCLTRRDYITIAGQFEGADWVSNTGTYSGHFHQPFFGIRPTGMLAHLRFGEFHKMVGGRAVESYVFLDLPQLMIAAGQWPIAESPGHDRGYTGYLPGPTAQDGLHWSDTDPHTSAASEAMVTTMLRKLATPDEAWRPYWHEDMIWYGPAAFGSFVGIERFASFQVPFESAFEGWSGGAAGNGMTTHVTRFGDGGYTCSAGWPSLTGVHVGRFLGVEPTGQRVFMRVCDWWSRRDDRLFENWVFVDIPHVLLQLGRDVLAEGTGA